MSTMKMVIKNSNWWRRRRTISERCLLLVLALAFVLPTNQMEEGSNKDIPTDSKNLCDHCATEECILSAASALSKIKKDVDPCDDFYQFACGKYLEENEIPKDRPSVGIFAATSNKAQKQLKAILTEERHYTDPMFLRLPNLFYKACMGRNFFYEQSFNFLTEVLAIYTSWYQDAYQIKDMYSTRSLQNLAVQFKHFGFNINYIVGFSVGEDLKDNRRRIITLDQSYLGLNREHLLKGMKEDAVSRYYNYMISIAKRFGFNGDSDAYTLTNTIKLEIDLAKISVSDEYRKRYLNNLFNLHTIKKLQVISPCIDWVDYINALLPENVTVDENEVINLAAPNFFYHLCSILDRHGMLVIVNYLFWRIHLDSMAFMPENFDRRIQQHGHAFRDEREEAARSEVCTNAVSSSSLKYALYSLYVRKYFNKESKAIALEMEDGIRAAFIQVLDKNDWMDSTTKKEAQKKLHGMTAHVGYPDELLDNDILEKFYNNLTIHPHSFLKSSLALNAFDMNKSFSKLRLPVNKNEWTTRPPPYEVNAYYVVEENSIQILAGILQGHYFNSQLPKYMNYGAIGSVIGHEITHGFDDRGRHYDVNASLFDWWQADSAKKFLEKAECITEQCTNFRNNQTGLNLNGALNQNENIADDGGLRMAYVAYKQWVAKNHEELKLPGLNYTTKQMFWISFAQSHCAKTTTEKLRKRIATEKHSIEEFRVLGTLRNNKDFSNDFHCREGTPMNPLQKCKIW